MIGLTWAPAPSPANSDTEHSQMTCLGTFGIVEAVYPNVAFEHLASGFLSQATRVTITSALCPPVNPLVWQSTLAPTLVPAAGTAAEDHRAPGSVVGMCPWCWD